MEMLMKPQLCVSSNATDDYLRYLRQMNISHCFVMFRNEETNYDAVNRTLERVRAAGLTVDDAGNGFLYKHPSIQLGLPDRDEWIAKVASAKTRDEVGVIMKEGVKAFQSSRDKDGYSAFATAVQKRGAELKESENA